MDRRCILKVVGSGVVWASATQALAIMPKSRAFGGQAFATAIARTEHRAQGRLGVAVLDLETGARFSQRGDERFPMCSTFKFLLAAAVLRAVDGGRLALGRAVPIPRVGIVANSPAVAPMAGRTMTVGELCAATMTQSDNAAANLLLPMIGGVAGFNAFARLIGDRATRLDRTEPGLNMGAPGDPRDTTTPNAMLASMHAVLFGRTLSHAARERLNGWLVANTTGKTRLRAGLPAGWRIGDKTGTGEHGTANDIGVLWPHAERRPMLVTSYLTASRAPQAVQYAAHADVARAIAAALA
jgi:beta-lactamase class A